VGIGASAGGLEAFTQLLSFLPSDTGMAFVLVQHLDPNHKSLLTEILSRSIAMPVREVQDSMAVEPDNVYVIPPNRTMKIAHGSLHLSPRAKMTIDEFFFSLATERGGKAIGVILSGGDADGSLGLEAIKEAGGITFAQSENSAGTAIMPHNAIATGQVDFILSPEQIAEKLVSISRHPYVTSSTSGPTIESEKVTDSIGGIFALLRSTTGVDFTDYKHTTIRRRIFRRMALYRLDDLDDYVSYLQENKAEVQALYQELLINVTKFFRDATVFKTLKQKVFPALTRSRGADAPIRFWVAGCSTGEEAYSLAICLLEFLAHYHYKPTIQIFATDVNEFAIEKARLGIYKENQMVDVPPGLRERFFTKIDDGYQINKSVRELCIFARQNLIADPPFSKLDLISCRNVFIYFGTALQKKVLSVFHYGLMPAGFLLLGSSETVGELPDLFTPIDQKGRIFTKQPSSISLNWEPSSPGYGLTNHSTGPLIPLKSNNELELQSLTDEIVLKDYAPAGVVIDANLEIILFRGQTGNYLEPSPGRASLNLFNLAREELRLELRTAVHQAKQSGQPVKKDRISLIQKKAAGDQELPHSHQIRINVIPFQLKESHKDYFLVLFERLLTPATLEGDFNNTGRNRIKRKQASAEQQEMERLQQELLSTKAYLQSIISEQQSTNQDLRAANEEILSSNEELQSTNEELQTAKEEIQATNEELSTINEELYRRNVFSTNVSNDLQNLLGSINIPLLILESDLRIRRFTATAAQIFNLIPGDIGRPFSDIKHNLDFPNLEQQILEVIDTLNLYHQEVRDLKGHWYDLRIRPYRTLDNRIDGAVVVLIDINTLKRGLEEVRAARDYAEAIVQTVRQSLIVLNAGLQVVTANEMFYQTFGISAAETEGRLIFDLEKGAWNIPRLRLLLEELLVQNTQIQNFEVQHDFERVGSKSMRINARRMPPLEGGELILLVFEDMG
jgi:two-component system CheB/CheR fusion protein